LFQNVRSLNRKKIISPVTQTRVPHNLVTGRISKISPGDQNNSLYKTRSLPLQREFHPW